LVVVTDFTANADAASCAAFAALVIASIAESATSAPMGVDGATTVDAASVIGVATTSDAAALVASLSISFNKTS
jgi:hypothetical protein